MRPASACRRLIAAYPRIYFACHLAHRRDPATDDKLSAHQGSILDHLDDIEGTSLQCLAEHMGVTPSTMSLNIDRLQARGYVERRRDSDDGRRVRVFLTESGLRVKSAQSVLDPQLVLDLIRRLTPADRERAIAGLELLAVAAGQTMSARSRSRAWAARRRTGPPLTREPGPTRKRP